MLKFVQPVDNSDDRQKVIQILGIVGEGSLRILAAGCGWRNEKGQLNSARVHRALLALAADGLVVQHGKRWRVRVSSPT